MLPKPFTSKLLPPPHQPLSLPTTASPHPTTNPSVFNDAFAIRTTVFINEQGCSLDGELDADDRRSWHWVIYSGATPIATIRLVPPPHAPHEAFADPAQATALPRYDLQVEPCVRITRVAVLKEYRGLGLGRLLVDMALGWAASHPGEVQEAYERAVREEEQDDQQQQQEGGGGDVKRELPGWTGLALTHAQVAVEKMYRRVGFETDKELGTWVEEGIEHVGMWKRVEVCG